MDLETLELGQTQVLDWNLQQKLSSSLEIRFLSSSSCLRSRFRSELRSEQGILIMVGPLTANFFTVLNKSEWDRFCHDLRLRRSNTSQNIWLSINKWYNWIDLTFRSIKLYLINFEWLLIENYNWWVTGKETYFKQFN